MNRVKRAVVGITMLALPVLIFACATVPSQSQVKTAVLAKAGDTVQLFHGGNKLAKDEFCLNAIVTIYRYYPPYASVAQRSEVGKVKITGFVGDHYLEGVVIEGRIWNGDIAVQPNSECLIRVPGPEDK
jgi:hypothetical protein